MATLEPNMLNMTKEERQGYQAQRAAANQLAIKRLRSYGRRLKVTTSYGVTVEVIQEVTRRALGARSTLEYLQAFLDGKLDQGEKAPSRTPAPFKPLRLPITLQRNFERVSQAQTTLYTPCGYGEYSRSWGGSEGKL